MYLHRIGRNEVSKLLLIEDMKGVRDSLRVILKLAGHQVEEAVNGKEGLKMMELTSYDLVITDILMPEKDGTEVIMESKKIRDTLPILAISAGGGDITADQALAIAAQKADAVLEKPFSKDQFLQKIAELTQ